MTEINQVLLDMIRHDKTIGEIEVQLGLSHKEIYQRLYKLKLEGYNIQRYFNDIGQTQYTIENKMIDHKMNNRIYPIHNLDPKNIRMMFFSDTHLGHKHSRMDLIHKIYEYCDRVGIHIVVIVGDFIEGQYHMPAPGFETTEKQIKYVLKEFPYYKNIITFILLGNHDLHSLFYGGYDISAPIESKRNDLIMMGYGRGYLDVNDNFIELVHRLSVIDTPPRTNDRKIKATIIGHGHEAKTNISRKTNEIYLPTISNVAPNGQEIVPGGIEIQFDLECGIFRNICLKNVVCIEDSFKKVSEFNLALRRT